MNKETMDRLKELYEEQRVEKIKHKHRMSALNKEIAEIYKGCDHLFPDGKNAYLGGFMYSECKICHHNDL